MKCRLVMMVILGALISASPALANNKAVEIAIRSHPELSTFYEALISTGVMNELKENEDYSVFAPTNDAFVQINAQEYPCFYSSQCREEVAAILRNHIIDEKYTIVELVKRGGNPASSIGKNDIYVEEPFKGKYQAEGHNVIAATETDGSIVFPIDGVVLQDNELDQFRNLKTPISDHTSAHPVPGGNPR